MVTLKLLWNFELRCHLWRDTIVLIPTIGIFRGNLSYKWSIEIYFFAIQIGLVKRRY